MTRIYYRINGLLVGTDTVNRVLTPAEIARYVRKAQTYMGKNVEHEVKFEL